MRLFKQLSVLIILAMLVATLGGCLGIQKVTTTADGNGGNGGDTTSADTDEPGGNTEPGSDDTDSTETYTEGQELTEFVDGYVNAKQPLWDALSNSEDLNEDPFAYMAIASFAFADMYIVNVYFFDAVDALGGQFGFSPIKNAYKKIEGNVVTFGYDYTYTESDNEDNNNYAAGSHVTCTGSYDMGKSCLKQEMVDEIVDGDTTRTVIEIVKLGNNSYASQILNWSKESGTVSAYFTMFNGTDMWVASGSAESGNDFAYNSIYGKSVSSLDDMTGGFTVDMKAQYVNGEASYEASSED